MCSLSSVSLSQSGVKPLLDWYSMFCCINFLWAFLHHQLQTINHRSLFWILMNESQMSQLWNLITSHFWQCDVLHLVIFIYIYAAKPFTPTRLGLFNLLPCFLSLSLISFSTTTNKQALFYLGKKIFLKIFSFLFYSIIFFLKKKAFWLTVQLYSVICIWVWFDDFQPTLNALIRE